MSEVIYLSNVRLSFPHIAEPQRKVNDAGVERISYNAEFIMDEADPGFQSFMAQYGKIALEKWGEHANSVMQMISADRKSRCYGKGEEKVNKKTFQPYDGYPGKVFITAGRDSAPQMIQADGNAVDPANTMAVQQIARKLYGGCRVNVAVKPWLQENKHGRGVRCDLIAIQFFADDTAFGEGAVDAAPMFGAVQMPGGQATPAATSAPADAPVAATAVPGLPPFLS